MGMAGSLAQRNPAGIRQGAVSRSGENTQGTMKARDRYFVEGVSCQLDGQALRVANLGIGGFFAESEDPPRLGQVLVMELMIPSRGACRVVGEVSWINGGRGRRHVPELPPGFGVKLTRLERRDREAIEEILKRSDPVLGSTDPAE